MDDDDIRAMNRRIELGWEPSRHQWLLVAERCKTMPEVRDSKVWGIKKYNRYKFATHEQIEGYEIIANPQFFHPDSLSASDLTYTEAEALIKILES